MASPAPAGIVTLDGTDARVSGAAATATLTWEAGGAPFSVTRTVSSADPPTAMCVAGSPTAKMANPGTGPLVS